MKMKLLLGVLLAVPCLASEEKTVDPKQGELWVYSTANFQVEQSVDELISLRERSKKAGYSAIVVNDFKFGKIDGRPDHFFRNLERARVAGDRYMYTTWRKDYSKLEAFAAAVRARD